MPRRKTAVLAREKKPDQFFNSVEVEMMNRLIVQHGKYQKACQIVKKALNQVFEVQVKNGLYRCNDAAQEKQDRRGSRHDRMQQEKDEQETKREFNLQEMDRREAIVVILSDVLDRAGPELELISKRIGGANIQVPVVVKQGRRTTLAIRAVVKNARKRKGKDAKSMSAALAAEILDVIRGAAQTLVDKENLLKMARANAVYSGTRR